MKIQLDMNNKTIKIGEDVNFDELLKTLDKLFPNKEWKQYKLLTNSPILWSTPYIIQKEYIQPYWKQPFISCNEGNELYLNISSGSISQNGDISYIETPSIDGISFSVIDQCNSNNTSIFV